MAIKKATAFTASDGSLCSTLEEAQKHELTAIALAAVKRERVPSSDDAATDQECDRAVLIGAIIYDQRDAILDILTTGPRSRPGARKVKGTTAPRRAAKATPEQAKAGIKAMREAVDREADNAGDMAAERLRQMPAEAVTT